MVWAGTLRHCYSFWIEYICGDNEWSQRSPLKLWDKIGGWGVLCGGGINQIQGINNVAKLKIFCDI